MSEQESSQVSEQEKEAIKELIDSSNLSLIGDGTMIVKNTTIATTLNYIDKLQKENQELKKQEQKYIIHLTDEQYRKVIDNAQDDVRKEFEQKLQEKDNVIDLMAKKIKAQDPFASVLDIDEKIIIGKFYKKAEEENE